MIQGEKIRFETTQVTDEDSGLSIEASVLATPLGDVTPEFKTIVIDGEVLDCEDATVAVVSRALRRVHALETHGQIVDCSGFAGLVAGGKQHARPKKATVADAVKVSVTHHLEVPIKEENSKVILKPFMLGTMIDDRLFAPRHAHVRLSSERDLWLGRLGAGSVIATTSLNEAAHFYQATHSARVQTMYEIHGGRTVLSYRETDE